MRTIQRASVIGTGMMGPGIAATLALGGIRTTILSRTVESAERGLETAVAQAKLLGEHGLAPAERAAAAPALLGCGTDWDAAAGDSDLVIESAPENMAFKQELFARLDRAARPEAILASNTSGLSITSIASRCANPERVVTTHFWNPPHLMPLVEIVRGEKTAEDVVATLGVLLRDCGKAPVVVKKDRPGQLGNRLQLALIREAVNIVQEGIADPDDVDTAARAGFGLRLPVYGIFEHQDMVGLDMGYAIADYVCRDLFNEPRAPELFAEKVAAGHLGAKVGRGFHDWTVKDAAAVRSRRDKFVCEFLKSEFGEVYRTPPNPARDNS